MRAREDTAAPTVKIEEPSAYNIDSELARTQARALLILTRTPRWPIWGQSTTRRTHTGALLPFPPDGEESRARLVYTVRVRTPTRARRGRSGTSGGRRRGETPSSFLARRWPEESRPPNSRPGMRRARSPRRGVDSSSSCFFPGGGCRGKILGKGRRHNAARTI